MIEALLAASSLVGWLFGLVAEPDVRRRGCRAMDRACFVLLLVVLCVMNGMAIESIEWWDAIGYI